MMGARINRRLVRRSLGAAGWPLTLLGDLAALALTIATVTVLTLLAWAAS